MKEPRNCPSHEQLVTYLYDECEPAESSQLQAHTATCPACRQELTRLDEVRGALGEWAAPELTGDIRVVVGPRERPSPWAWLLRPAFPLAAAAALVLGAAAGLANLEVRYGTDGFVVRTGRGQDASSRSTSAAPAAATASLERPRTPSVARPIDATGDAPWRTELAALERELRAEFSSANATREAGAIPGVRGATTRPVGTTPATLDPQLAARIQALIDESEIRQQRNLALRVAELSRDFDLQRRTDLVQIQQGLGRLEGQTQAEAARTREMMNYIVRVSQQPPK